MTPKPEKAKSEQTGSRDRGRVLLITDQPLAVHLRALESTGLEIVGVSGTAAALVTLQRSRPHVVIASINARGISTHELARMLAQTQDGVPLIFVGVDSSTPERRLAALAAGAFDYLQIPSELELLRSRAIQLVALRQT